MSSSQRFPNRTGNHNNVGHTTPHGNMGRTFADCVRLYKINRNALSMAERETVEKRMPRLAV